MTLETLNEDDLDWLTRVENRLATMRKRETQHRPQSFMVTEISDTIRAVRSIRITLQARFAKHTDEYL